MTLKQHAAARELPTSDVLLMSARIARVMEQAYERGESCPAFDEDSIRVRRSGDVDVPTRSGAGVTDAGLRSFGRLLERGLAGSWAGGPGDPDSLAAAPAPLREIMERCREEDRSSAAAPDIRTIRLKLEALLEQTRDRDSALAGTRRERHRQLGIGALAAVVVVSTGTLALALLDPDPRVDPVPGAMAFTLPVVPAAADVMGPPQVSMAPDDRSFLLVDPGDRTGGTVSLQSLDDGSRTLLPDIGPIFGALQVSPDGEQVAFYARASAVSKVVDSALWVAPLAGGPPVQLAGGVSRGLTWTRDGRIVFVPNVHSGLAAVSAAGGDARILTVPDASRGEITHRWPSLLPDGKTLLFTIGLGRIHSFDDAEIAAYSLETGRIKVILAGGSKPTYVTGGHLLFTRSGRLMVAPFDLKTLEVTGPVVAAVEGVTGFPATGEAIYAISPGGTLAYLPGGLFDLAAVDWTWVDRDGTTTPAFDTPRPVGAYDLSPDGRRVVVTRNGYHDDVWMWDVERSTMTRLTFGSSNGTNPIWSPDGKRVAYSSRTTGTSDVFWSPADGSAPATVLATGPADLFPATFSPDGRFLVYLEVDGVGGFDLWLQPLSGDAPRRPLVATPARETEARFSPDGRWVAYTSDVSGTAEIYVRSFEPSGNTGLPVRISSGGGGVPRWSGRGELFFLHDGHLMVVGPLSSSRPDRFSPPRPAFDEDMVAKSFDVTADGKRFLLSRQLPVTFSHHMNVVLRWADTLSP
ncbi:MAG: TolB family protein [Acidobacteriota bacterium]